MDNPATAGEEVKWILVTERPAPFDEPILADIEYNSSGHPLTERIVCVNRGGELETEVGDDIGWPDEVITRWIPLAAFERPASPPPSGPSSTIATADLPFTKETTCANSATPSISSGAWSAEPEPNISVASAFGAVRKPVDSPESNSVAPSARCPICKKPLEPPDDSPNYWEWCRCASAPPAIDVIEAVYEECAQIADSYARMSEDGKGQEWEDCADFIAADIRKAAPSSSGGKADCGDARPIGAEKTGHGASSSAHTRGMIQNASAQREQSVLSPDSPVTYSDPWQAEAAGILRWAKDTPLDETSVRHLAHNLEQTFVRKAAAPTRPAEPEYTGPESYNFGDPPKSSTLGEEKMSQPECSCGKVTDPQCSIHGHLSSAARTPSVSAPDASQPKCVLTSGKCKHPKYCDENNGCVYLPAEWRDAPSASSSSAAREPYLNLIAPPRFEKKGDYIYVSHLGHSPRILTAIEWYLWEQTRQLREELASLQATFAAVALAADHPFASSRPIELAVQELVERAQAAEAERDKLKEKLEVMGEKCDACGYHAIWGNTCQRCAWGITNARVGKLQSELDRLRKEAGPLESNTIATADLPFTKETTCANSATPSISSGAWSAEPEPNISVASAFGAVRKPVDSPESNSVAPSARPAEPLLKECWEWFAVFPTGSREFDLKTAHELYNKLLLYFSAAPSRTGGEEKMSTNDAALKADVAQTEHSADNGEVGGTPVSAGKLPSALRAASAPDAVQPKCDRAVLCGLAKGHSGSCWIAAPAVPASAARECNECDKTHPCLDLDCKCQMCVFWWAQRHGIRVVLSQTFSHAIEFAEAWAEQQTRQLREELASWRRLSERLQTDLAGTRLEHGDALKILRESEIDRSWDGDETLIAAVSIAAAAIHYRNVTIKDLEQRAQAAEAERDKLKEKLEVMGEKCDACGYHAIWGNTCQRCAWGITNARVGKLQSELDRLRKEAK